MLEKQKLFLFSFVHCVFVIFIPDRHFFIVTQVHFRSGFGNQMLAYTAIVTFYTCLLKNVTHCLKCDISV